MYIRTQITVNGFHKGQITLEEEISSCITNSASGDELKLFTFSAAEANL